MAFRWPTDPAGKKPSHTISWDQHQTNLKAKAGQVVPAADVAQPGDVLPLPPPPDASYEADVASLTSARDKALADAAQQRTAGLLDFGYNEDAATGALAFDPNNPFSKAALLKKNYDTSRARSAQSMGSTGQLYSGAFQNQQDLVNRGQLQDEDTLQKSLAAFLTSNLNARTQAGTDYQLGMQRADADRLGRIDTNPLYAPVVSAADARAVTPSKGIGTATSQTKQPTTIKAGPGVKATKNTTVKKTQKGKTVTYSTSIKGP